MADHSLRTGKAALLRIVRLYGKVTRAMVEINGSENERHAARHTQNEVVEKSGRDE